jgi:hypothetical protein
MHFLRPLAAALALLPSAQADSPPTPLPPSPPPASEAAEPAKSSAPDYIRFREDDTAARLEVALRSLTLPDGTTIDLAGAVHIADASYYEDLNSRFPKYDAVLYELVGNPADLKEAQQAPKEPEAKGRANPIRFLQQSMGSLLKLSFQLEKINYSLPNLVHADVTAEEFAALQKARGESMMSLWAKAMAAQYDEDNADLRAATELDAGRILRMLLSRNAAAEFKTVFAKMFDQAERATASLEGDSGSAILKDRNEVAFRKLREITTAKPASRLCIFYGAAHMPGIEALIISELQGKPSGSTWLPAWTMPKTPPKPSPEPSPEPSPQAAPSAD